MTILLAESLYTLEFLYIYIIYKFIIIICLDLKL